MVGKNHFWKFASICFPWSLSKEMFLYFSIYWGKWALQVKYRRLLTLTINGWTGHHHLAVGRESKPLRAATFVVLPFYSLSACFCILPLSLRRPSVHIFFSQFNKFPPFFPSHLCDHLLFEYLGFFQPALLLPSLSAPYGSAVQRHTKTYTPT